MKKLIAIVLTAVILFGAAASAYAEEIDYNKVQFEFGNTYTISYIPSETPDEPGFTYLFYNIYAGAKTAYIPRTLAGVELTTETLTGANIYDLRAPFSVDEDNPYFTVRDGVLFTKDGKTMVSCPLAYIYGRHNMNEDTAFDYGFYRIPEGTERLGCESIRVSNSACVVFPPSVTEIDPDCGIYEDACIAALPGSAAERYANENGILFLPLGETHTHTWFRVENVATCISDGNVRAECPCGAIAQEKTLAADPEAHWFDWFREESTDLYGHICVWCGKVDRYYRETETTDCTCACHTLDKYPVPTFQNSFTTTIRNIVYRIRLFFWRMTGTHQYCECGARHY